MRKRLTISLISIVMVCGVLFSLMGCHKHYWSDYIFYDGEDFHTIQCIYCGEIKLQEKHKFVDGKCVCGEQDFTHEHEWIDYSDSEYHGTRCTKCGMIKDKFEHILVWDYNDLNHWQKCSCGYQSEITAHKYSVFKGCECGYNPNKN
ncbi:MAG: hypothetical protein K2P12_00310 [Clostridia bacterium]|nr:hypothetical protein [Clostridia bacterium]